MPNHIHGIIGINNVGTSFMMSKSNEDTMMSKSNEDTINRVPTVEYEKQKQKIK